MTLDDAHGSVKNRITERHELSRMPRLRARLFGRLGRIPAFAHAVRCHAAALWREGAHAAAAACR